MGDLVDWNQTALVDYFSGVKDWDRGTHCLPTSLLLPWKPYTLLKSKVLTSGLFIFVIIIMHIRSQTMLWHIFQILKILNVLIYHAIKEKNQQHKHICNIFINRQNWEFKCHNLEFHKMKRISNINRFGLQRLY